MNTCKLILFFLFKTYAILFSTQDNLLQIIEKELEVTVPKEMKYIWSKNKWKESNRYFHYLNHPELFLLLPDELHQYTLERKVQDFYEEKRESYEYYNSGEITEESYEEKVQGFYVDIVMQSKFVNKELENQEVKLSKSLVFATCTWHDTYVFMFYAFDKNQNKGIWIWNMNGTINKPMFLGKDIKAVFKKCKKLKKGFSNIENIRSFGERHTYETFSDVEMIDSIYPPIQYINHKEFMYGIFPQKDLRIIAKEICPEIVFFPNAEVEYLDENTRQKIDNLYKQKGRKNIFDNLYHIYALSHFQYVNREEFNNQENDRIFQLNFRYGNHLALCNCSTKQRDEFHKFGFLNYN